MARHKTKTNNWRLTLDRLGSKDLWSWQFIAFAAVVYGLFTFLMDVLRTENFSWLWALTYFSSLGIAVLLAWLAKKFLLNHIPPQVLSLVNLVLAALIGAIKNAFVGWRAMAFGLEENVNVLDRAAGGVFMGVAMLATYAAISGARGEHKQALVKLARIQSDLLGSKDNLEVALKDELEKLQTRSRETVLPKIAQINALLVDDSKTSEVVEQISETVHNQVRPLMEEIANESHDRFPRIEEDLTRKIKVRTPKQFVPADVPQPWIYFGYLSPGLALLAFFFQGLPGALVGFAAGTLTIALHFGAAKWLLPKREVGKAAGYLLLILVAVVLPIPSLYLEGMVLELTRMQSYVLPIVTWTVSILVPLALAPMFLLDSERVKIEAQIANENHQLSKELARFEQRLWVFKKRWLFMLHGTVQGALTAALTRLQTFTDSDPYQASLVRADLDRVRVALQTPPSDEIDFAKAASDIKDAWEGVCGIRLTVDMRAERALTTSNQAAYCVNEIMKEAVGNAVRHGSARAIDIQITRTEEDSIDLQIQNNGTPVAKNWKRGIGSRMLDDITVDWSLKRVGKLTTLKARLPL